MTVMDFCFVILDSEQSRNGGQKLSQYSQYLQPTFYIDMQCWNGQMKASLTNPSARLY